MVKVLFCFIYNLRVISYFHKFQIHDEKYGTNNCFLEMCTPVKIQPHTYFAFRKHHQICMLNYLIFPNSHSFVWIFLAVESYIIYRILILHTIVQIHQLKIENHQYIITPPYKLCRVKIWSKELGFASSAPEQDTSFYNNMNGHNMSNGFSPPVELK